MISSKDRIGSRLRYRGCCCLLSLVMLLSLSMFASQEAAASQDVTLTLTCSTTSTYIDEDFVLHVTASAPITGTVKLYWTINGTGPYIFLEQMTNGVSERDFAGEVTGNWTLWYVWDGNEQYNASQSNKVSVMINPGSPPTDWTLFTVVAVLLAIVVVAGIFVFMRSKSKRR